MVWAPKVSFVVHFGEEPSVGTTLCKREGFQKSVISLFKSVATGSAMIHLRRRMDRWVRMSTLPGHRPNKARTVLEVLKRKATPRIQAAYLRTICDGWCTKYRFQGHGPCAFGCSGGQDKLHHYACCEVVSGLFAAGLNLHGPAGLDSFLCMHDIEEEVIKTRAVGIYALYRLHNGVRHCQFTPQEFQGAFRRFIAEGLK